MKGDSALEIITPLYTSIDEKSGNLQGILVNRGRIPYEYKDSGMHLTPSNKEAEVEGVIFYSEGSGLIEKSGKVEKKGIF